MPRLMFQNNMYEEQLVWCYSWWCTIDSSLRVKKQNKLQVYYVKKHVQYHKPMSLLRSAVKRCLESTVILCYTWAVMQSNELNFETLKKVTFSA